MKLSPLQMTRCVVTNIGCAANQQFDPEKEIQGALEHFFINAKASPVEPEIGVKEHSWSVELEIIQKKAEGTNYPYDFNISIFGFFTCKDGILPTEKETQFVQVNGCSMLYGMAREHIRSLTATGPWGAIILPTMSFYEQKEQPKKEDSAAKAP